MLAAGCFYLATIIGSLIGTNTQWRETGADGVTIYVETNGFHTGLILPARTEGIDWHELFPPQDTILPPGGADHIGIGWGERDFYLSTPSWSDLDPATLIRASIGSDKTLLHIYQMRRPAPGRYARPVRISVEAYRTLAAEITRSIAFPLEGPLQPLPGYGRSDVFYPATGQYSAIHSCNEWTGRVLRKAGVRIGAWTPTASGVMRWFPERTTRR